MNFEVLLCMEVLQILLISFVTSFSRSMNVTWAVQLPSKSVATMPNDDDTAKVILPVDLILAGVKFNKNILHMPTGASRKNIFSWSMILRHSIPLRVVIIRWWNGVPMYEAKVISELILIGIGSHNTYQIYSKVILLICSIHTGLLCIGMIPEKYIHLFAFSVLLNLEINKYDREWPRNG